MNFPDRLLIFCIAFLSFQPLHAQNDPFETSWRKDIPLTGVAGLIWTGGYLAELRMSPADSLQIASLNSENLAGIDRFATRNYNPASGLISDIILYASILSPVSALSFSDARDDILPLGLMIFQTGALINGITNLTKASVKRYRPYVYNPNVPTEYKYTRNARQSFFSGHTSHSAAFTFLTAYLIDSYTQNRDIERLSYGMAFLIPAAVGYLRISSGKHFPTDVLSGFVVGIATGLVVPWIHREAESNDSNQLPGGMNMRAPQFRLVIML